jgi:hypothetical protein
MRIGKYFVAGVLAAWAGGAGAAILDVASLRITGFDFYLTSPTGARFDPTNKVVVGGDLLAGPVNPILRFDLSVPSIAQDGPVTADTTAAAAFARVDTIGGSLNLDLSTFNMDWDSARCAENNPSFPSCINIPQGPGTITRNVWNPATGSFELAWSRVINRHPAQGGIGNWLLAGTAVPVPEPSTYLLLLVGLVTASVATLRRRR